MSGSGGSGYGGGFGQGVDSCESLVIHTQLSSPVAQVVGQLQVDDVLAVRSRPGQGVTLVEAVFQGQVAGGIAAPQIHRLMQCLTDGYKYQATVTAISGGQVKIRVQVV